jgi:hypothetical protein
MPYRRAVKVSDKVYERLVELTKRYNLESPNQLLEKLLERLLIEGVTPSETDRVTPCPQQQQQNQEVASSPPHRVTPSKPVQVSLWQNDPFWYLIRVGEGLHVIEISLNLIQMSKLCYTGLLAEEVCAKAQEVSL